jgi:hypothetical protein
MTREPIKNIKERILDRIRSGQVVMRPKWHFVLKALLAAVGGLLLLLAALYLVSFILFVARQTGAWFGPGFGPPGVGALLRSLPWTLIILSVIFVAILEVLARRYAFAYRRPLLYSIAAIVLLVLVGGVLVAPLHRALFRDMREHRLSMFAERFYRGFGPLPFPSRELYRGTVAELTSGGLILEDFQGVTTSVRFTPRTRMIRGGTFAVGDEVAVFGMTSGTDVFAHGIRALPLSE